jgi:hypothetical protein
MHEIDYDLGFLGYYLPLFVYAFHFSPDARVKEEQGKAANKQAEQKEKHGKSEEPPDMRRLTVGGNGGNRVSSDTFRALPGRWMSLFVRELLNLTYPKAGEGFSCVK